MANNTNQQAINFCNQKLRPAIDAMVTAILSLQVLTQQWTAQDIAAIIPNDSNFVQDGSTVASGTADGRPPITDANVNLVIANANSLIASMTANSNLLLNQWMEWTVNGRSVI